MKNFFEELGCFVVALAIVLAIAYFIFTNYQPFMDSLK